MFQKWFFLFGFPEKKIHRLDLRAFPKKTGTKISKFSRLRRSNFHRAMILPRKNFWKKNLPAARANFFTLWAIVLPRKKLKPEARSPRKFGGCRYNWYRLPPKQVQKINLKKSLWQNNHRNGKGRWRAFHFCDYFAINFSLYLFFKALLEVVDFNYIDNLQILAKNRGKM